jgi:clan AA aspartic protease
MLKPIPRKLEGVNYMGLTHVPVTVRNARTYESFTKTFLIDTGATESMAPAFELRRIGIKPVGKKWYELASGKMEEFEFGLAEVSFMDEITAGQILFGPDDTEPLLGVILLESAGLIVDPKNQELRRLSLRPLK